MRCSVLLGRGVGTGWVVVRVREVEVEEGWSRAFCVVGREGMLGWAGLGLGFEWEIGIELEEYGAAALWFDGNFIWFERVWSHFSSFGDV